jgi:hypothetical protein
MARKRSAREETDSSKPRQLRKQLRKAEDQLADAVQKRDRAQARVEALSIIADEIRAQLADAEKASADGPAAPDQPAKTPRRRKRPGAGAQAQAEGQAPTPTDSAEESAPRAPRAARTPRRKASVRPSLAASETPGAAG